MRRLGLVMAIATTVFVAPTTAVAATHVTYTSPDCIHLHVRPTKIVFACADGNFYATHLTWDSWEVRTAVGEGLFHLNDCRPDCAGGTFHNRRGRIVLRRRVRCAGLHKHVFRHASVTFQRPLLGRTHESFRLLLPPRC
jgi:hypothetical protein